jgi:hypothetical protein
LAFIDETMHSFAQRRHEQVQSPVAVDVRKRRAGGLSPGQADPCLGSDVFEPPSAKVTVEGVCAPDRAQIQVAPAVTIQITRRHTRTVHQVIVGSRI